MCVFTSHTIFLFAALFIDYMIFLIKINILKGKCFSENSSRNFLDCHNLLSFTSKVHKTSSHKIAVSVQVVSKIMFHSRKPYKHVPQNT